MEKMTIGTSLQTLRKQKGISMQVLADELHVTRQTISKWESNQSLPDIEILMQICDYYGVTLNELLSKEDKDSVKNVYEQMHQKLDHLQHQNKRKNIFNIVLICISILSLCVSLFMGNMNKKLLNDRTQDLINEGFFMSERSRIRDKLYDTDNNYKFLKSCFMNVGKMDVENKTVSVEYEFELNEYNQDTNVSIEFCYFDTESRNEVVKRYNLESLSDNQFRFKNVIPLTNYIESNLMIDDGNGNIRIEDLRKHTRYKDKVLDNFINLYVPVNGKNELDKQKIIYVPTRLKNFDSYISSRHQNFFKKFEGSLNIAIYNSISDKVYFEGDIDLNDSKELLLNAPLPDNEYITINIALYVNGEEYLLNKIFNLSVDEVNLYNSQDKVYIIN